MDASGAHFVVLPERRADLWPRALDFLRAWRDVPASGRGLTEATLTRAEAALGVAFPSALRECYAEFGGLIGAGYFDDGANALLPPPSCHLVGDPPARTLVLGGDYHGALWGVRVDPADGHATPADPPVRCVDTGGVATDDLFSLTEFLVGLLFRATVRHAPLRLRVPSPIGQRHAATALYDELRAHLPAWERGNRERDCGFLGHLEGDEIIASLTDEALELGLRSEAAISQLPQPLAGQIARLAHPGATSAPGPQHIHNTGAT